MRRTITTRIILGILILLNLWMIYHFSNESAATSGKTSEAVTRPIASVVVKDFTSKPKSEQNAIIKDMQLPVRKLAHMSEFGMLGMLILLFLRTWKLSLLSCFEGSMLSVILVAAADELHQKLGGQGRAGLPTDVLIDCGGALICTLCLCGILCLIQHSKKRKHTHS